MTFSNFFFFEFTITIPYSTHSESVDNWVTLEPPFDQKQKLNLIFSNFRSKTYSLLTTLTDCWSLFSHYRKLNNKTPRYSKCRTKNSKIKQNIDKDQSPINLTGKKKWNAQNIFYINCLSIWNVLVISFFSSFELFQKFSSARSVREKRKKERNKIMGTQ